MIVESLQHIPFFRSLSPQTLAEISAKLHQVHLEHDEVVFVEGDLGASMYLIESGQVKVSIHTGPGQPEKIINHLGPGNFFGEMALILDQRRTATVTVSIDADLWMLHKADLDELLIDNPEIALQITKELSRRLSDTVTETSHRPGYRLSAIFGAAASQLAESIQRQTGQRVVLYNASGQSLSKGTVEQTESLVILDGMSNVSSDEFVETLGILADGYDWVLVALPAEFNDIGLKAVHLADATVLCGVPRYDWILKTCDGPIFECDGTQANIDRTARRITHRVVGLALSSGGARGIAHIGVLQTLEKAGIPIDMIAGTSAGSLFGGLYATGKPTAEIAEFARGLIKLIDFKSGLWDPKFSRPWNGLIKGKATVKYLAKQFNDATFADTKIPFYVVAADVLSGEEVVFDQGPLADAVRASIGMIGIFSPYQINGQYLIDGGAVNPVPASVLAERGANIIIASSVIPSLEEERARGQAAAHRNEQPNFFGVLSNMMSIMEREIVKTRMAPVDVLIKPKVEVFTAMDYDNANDFLQLGQEATEQNLPLLKKLFAN
jgi:NTE family protein